MTKKKHANEEVKETNMEFPCEFTLKLFGLADSQFETAALTIVKAHVHNLNDQALAIRSSANGKYESISITFTAESREQLDNLYRALSDSPEILMAL